MSNTETASLILFDDFEPGVSLGQCTLAYDETLARQWRYIFGNSQPATGQQAEAASAAVILMMRAFLTVVSPRPPGNIHARQSLSFAALPKVGDDLLIRLECQGKEIKRDRRYVELIARGYAPDGSTLFQGMLTLIWAA